jgi:uncharacterized protein (DUF2147 family)
VGGLDRECRREREREGGREGVMSQTGRSGRVMSGWRELNEWSRSLRSTCSYTHLPSWSTGGVTDPAENDYYASTVSFSEEV